MQHSFRRALVAPFLLFAMLLACLAFAPASHAVDTPEWVKSFQESAAKAPDLRGTPDPMLVAKYAERYEVSKAEATRRIGLQAKAGDVVTKLKKALGDKYAGVWFDNSDGQFVAPVTASSDAGAAKAVFTTAGLSSDDVRTDDVRFTDKQLETFRDSAVKKLKDVPGASAGITHRSNKVLVSTVANKQSAARSAVESIPDVPDAAVTYQTIDKEVTPTACSWPYCQRETRGGIKIHGALYNSPSQWIACTAGFVSFKRSDLQPRLLTAGHCHSASIIENNARGAGPQGWYSNNLAGSETIGGMEAAQFGTGAQQGDAAYLRVNAGTYWYGPPYPFWRIAAWTVDEAYPIQSRSWPYIGQYGCRSGGNNIVSALSCGTTNATGVGQSYSFYGSNVQVNNLFRNDACSNGGDSGGPYVANYSAVGITSGGNGCIGAANGQLSLFYPVLSAETALGYETLTQFTPF